MYVILIEQTSEKEGRFMKSNLKTIFMWLIIGIICIILISAIVENSESKMSYDE